jgi:hypothetical protein
MSKGKASKTKVVREALNEAKSRGAASVPRILAGRVVGREVVILLPPMVETFELPSREELLALRPGAQIKLLFAHPDSMVERMWVALVDRSGMDVWVGQLNNEPFGLPARLNDRVEFHPLAIIATMPEAA